MKSNKFILKFVLSVAFFAVAFFSCDKIEAPYKETITIDTTSTDSVTYIRKVLVEDYTGHTCGNCPEAAQVLDTLLSSYKDRVVAMAVHAGSFANVSTTGIYTYNFKTSEGTELDNFFGISNAGNPNGMINRKGYSDLQHIIFHTDWTSKVDEELKKAPSAHIALTLDYNSGSRSLKVAAKSLFLQNLDGNFKLCLFVTEDSIIGAQKDYRFSGAASNLTSYKHKHVLRTSINSVWGEVIASGSVKINDEFLKEYTVSLKSDWNDKKCHVVAFIYNSATYEVIQAEEAHVE